MADSASGGAEGDFLQDASSKKWNSSAEEAVRLSDKAAFTRHGYLTPNYAALNKGFAVCAPRVHPAHSRNYLVSAFDSVLFNLPIVGIAPARRSLHRKCWLWVSY